MLKERTQQVVVINSHQGLNISSTVLESDVNLVRAKKTNHEGFKPNGAEGFSNARRKLNFRRRALAVQESIHAIADRGLVLGAGIDIIKTAADARQSGIQTEQDIKALLAIGILWIVNGIVDAVTRDKKQETENKIKAVTEAQQSGLIQYQGIYPLDS